MVRMSTMRSSLRLQIARTPTLAMCCLSPPGFADSWDSAAQREDAVNSLVLGRLLDDHSQTWHFGAAIATTADVVSLQDRMDDAPQVSPGDDRHNSGATVGGRRS